MTLMVPKGPSWSYCSTSLDATPSAGPYGFSHTFLANNADSTPATLISALSHDVEYFIVSFSNNVGPSGINTSALADIMIDPAGGTSWSELIPDLLAGFSITTSSSSTVTGHQYYFPIWIPAGASIGIRGRTAHTSNVAMRVIAYAFGENANPGSWWAGQRVTAYGITAASSTGTAHTCGESGSYSSWANIGNTLSYPTHAFQFAVQGGGDDNSGTSSRGYYFQMGAGSTQIGNTMQCAISSAENMIRWNPGIIWNSQPAGTQMQIRGTISGTDLAGGIDVAIYGVS